MIQDPRQRRRILITVCIALMAVIASVSGLNVAQPQLTHTFGASQTEVLWFINTYTLTLAALLLPLGALGDRRGRRPVLIAGLAVFGVASIAAGLAISSGVMLGARFLSGVGAAGWQQAMWAGAGVMVVLFVYVLVRGPERRPEASSTGDEETELAASVTR